MNKNRIIFYVFLFSSLRATAAEKETFHCTPLTHELRQEINKLLPQRITYQEIQEMVSTNQLKGCKVVANTFIPFEDIQSFGPAWNYRLKIKAAAYSSTKGILPSEMEEIERPRGYVFKVYREGYINVLKDKMFKSFEEGDRIYKVREFVRTLSWPLSPEYRICKITVEITPPLKIILDKIPNNTNG